MYGVFFNNLLTLTMKAPNKRSNLKKIEALDSVLGHSAKFFTALTLNKTRLHKKLLFFSQGASKVSEKANKGDSEVLVSFTNPVFTALCAATNFLKN